MRVLVTWSSRRGGTEGIGRMLAEALGTHGFDVVARPAAELQRLDSSDAVIVGGALYTNRWPADLRRFVHRHAAQLRAVPVWLFSWTPRPFGGARRHSPHASGRGARRQNRREGSRDLRRTSGAQRVGLSCECHGEDTQR
jgi:menaquinone-dependent protoporphyrinogen oxidase